MWNTEVVILLRYLINDLGVPPRYDDARLTQLLTVAANFVIVDVGLEQKYSTSITNSTIMPDPTSPRDNGFINLISIKAACIVDSGEARAVSGQAITIRDSGSEVALGNIASAKLALLTSKTGWCAAYEEARFAYLAGDVNTAGEAILGPYRIYSSAYGYVSPYPNDGRYR